MDPEFLATFVKNTKFLSSPDFSDALSDAVLMSAGKPKQCSSRFNSTPRSSNRKRRHSSSDSD